jgi:7,8-dihydropterin-6-yl-methyl-4-(beta-D-ribofuranosyl)aminobenzene 5'-phosphate synthase
MLINPCDCVARRDVLCGGGAAAFSAIVTGLLGTARPVRAETISGSVPEVDRLAVRVLVDSYQFAVAPSRKLSNVDIDHFGWGIGAGRPPGKTLVSEFGLSMHVESRRGTETRRVLIDFGFTPDSIINNFALLGGDPAALDALVLSHGHYDHFGGLAGFLQASKGQLKPKLPIFVGGEEAFCARTWTAPPARGDFGALDRKALEDANLTVTYAEGPALVADHGFTTGQIRQASFERLQAASGISKVHAVIGGFHLAPYPPDYVKQTVAAFKDIDVDYVIPLHCSGEPFYEMAKAEIPAKLLRSYTGTRFVFGEGAGT